MRHERTFMLFNLPPAERTWRGLRLLLAVYLGSLLFAALVSPWVYWGIQNLHEAFPRTFKYLAFKDFDDYFDRLRWVPVVLSLPIVFVKCHLFSFKQLGIVWGKGGVRRFLGWFGAGFALLLCVSLGQLFFSGAEFKNSLHFGGVVWILLKALAGGVVLGLLEEIVFRGLILRMFYTAGGPLLAVLLGSLFFAYAHFKMPGEIWQNAFPSHQESDAALVYALEFGYPPPDDFQRVTPWSGFFVAGWTLIGISENFQAIKFMNLFLLGIVLSIATLRTHSLLPAIGLHAGIVFALLSYRKLVDIPAQSWFFGSNALVDGVLPSLLLILLGLRFLWISPPTPAAFANSKNL